MPCKRRISLGDTGELLMSGYQELPTGPPYVQQRSHHHLFSYSGPCCVKLLYLPNSVHVSHPSFRRVVLALRTDAVSASLAEELARVIGPERCSRLRWPIGADELYGSSPESEFHQAWLDQAQDYTQEGLKYEEQWPSGKSVSSDDPLEVHGNGGTDIPEEDPKALSHITLPGTIYPEEDGGLVEQIGGSHYAAADEHLDKHDEILDSQAAEDAREDAPYPQLPDIQDAREEMPRPQLLPDTSDDPQTGSPSSASTSTHHMAGAAAPFSGMRSGAHDMLLRDGPEALVWHVSNMAVEWPLKGLYQMNSFHQVGSGVGDACPYNRCSMS